MSVEKFKAVEEERRVEQKPTIGRIVHYTSPNVHLGGRYTGPRTAIITAVNDDGTVGLFLLETTIGYEREPFDADGKAGTWRWPPRT